VPLAVKPAAFAEDGVPAGGGGVGQQRQQRSPEMGVAWVDAGQVVDGGGEIDQLDECVAQAGRDGDAGGRLDDQRDAGEAVLKGVLVLLDQAIVAGEIAVVAEDEQGRVVVDAGPASNRPSSASWRAHMPR
jgi:hypothetical protein